MFFNKKKKANKFVKAATLEGRKNQKAAIAAYYAKKQSTDKKRNN